MASRMLRIKGGGRKQFHVMSVILKAWVQEKAIHLPEDLFGERGPEPGAVQLCGQPYGWCPNSVLLSPIQQVWALDLGWKASSGYLG